MRIKNYIKNKNQTYTITTVCPYCNFENQYNNIVDLETFINDVLPIIKCLRCHKNNIDSGLKA
jgi:hypothetical protein